MSEPIPPTPPTPDAAPAPAPETPAAPGSYAAGPKPHQPPVVPPPPQRAPQAPRPQGPNPGAAGQPRGRDQFPRGDRPRNDRSPPPDLGVRDFAAGKPNTRALDQSIEDELSAALAGFDVGGTVKAEPKRPAPVPGSSQKKKGRIVGIHGRDVFVEIPGGRSQGMLPLQQFEGAPPVVGQEVEFEVERYDSANGLVLLTMDGAAQTVTDWSSVSLGMIVEARCTGLNKNKTGLLIEVNGIRGFMPVSQLDLWRVEDVDQFVNQRIKCQIVELDREERNLVVSRRAILEREREVLREQFWATVEQGQVKTGIVRSVKPFGAFVDLGGADGLIPVSELSWSRVGDPSEVVQIGQKVEVMVSRVDYDTRKIGLSLRALVRSPWDDFAAANKSGARIKGTVTRIMDFGAFVEVAPGIEGLIHISELSNLRVRKVRDVVTEGQSVAVEILNVDAANRKMGLSLKAIQSEAEAAEDAAAEAEREDDVRGAEERMAKRAANPNLRGGIGSGRIQFDGGEQQ